MSGLFVVPDHASVLGPCAWCSEPSLERVEVEPARYTTRDGIRLIKHRAIEVDVCPKHAAMVARNVAEAERR
jgi:hypothetical protein